MTFEIVIRSTGDYDMDTIRKGLRKGLELTELSRGPEGTIFRCSLKNLGGRPLKMDEQKTKEAVRLYMEGHSVNEIAKRFNCKSPVIRAAIGNLTKEREMYRLDQYHKLVSYGMDDNEIMKALNVSPYVFNNLKEKYPQYSAGLRFLSYSSALQKVKPREKSNPTGHFEMSVKGITDEETLKNVKASLGRGTTITETSSDPPSFICRDRIPSGYKQRSLSEADIKKVRDDYINGVSVADLAEKYDCTEQTIYAATNGLSEERRINRDTIVFEMHLEGKTDDAIMDSVGITKPTLNTIIEKTKEEDYQKELLKRLNKYKTLLDAKSKKDPKKS